MKLKNVLLTLGLALGAGAGIGAAHSVFNHPLETRASNSVSGTITINTQQYWSDAHDDGEGCHVAVYFYEGDKGTTSPTNTGWSSYVYVGLSQIEATVTYTLNFTPNYMIAVRYSNWLNESDWSGNEWRSGTWGKWNQTQDLLFRENSTIFITGWDWGLDSYFYYVTGSDQATGNYVYSYGGQTEFGGWPGKAVTSASHVDEVHGVLHFENTNQLIYRIPFDSAKTDTHIIIHNNSGSQTGNMPLVHGRAYWYVAGEVDVSDNAGQAIDFLLKAEKFRNAVRADGDKILNYSICGIDPADAAKLYETYEGYNPDIKSMIDRTTAHTYSGLYDGETVPSEIAINYSDIMARLYKIALLDNAFAQTHHVINISPIFVNSDNSGLVIAVTAFAAILATGGFFFLRRRKEQ